MCKWGDVSMNLTCRAASFTIKNIKFVVSFYLKTGVYSVLVKMS